jgi:hypothetical protein
MNQSSTFLGDQSTEASLDVSHSLNNSKANAKKVVAPEPVGAERAPGMQPARAPL